jgi:spore cortex biosynthesis protein YabQ
LVTISQEFAMFLGTVFTGAMLGLLFDVHRALTRPPRRLRKRLTPARLALDLAFWLIVTPLVFILLAAANLAELRGYVYLGLVLGFGLYGWLASPLLLGCLRWVLGRLGAARRAVTRAASIAAAWLKSHTRRLTGRT